MVYESDFYTTRRPYTRPISSHYTVTNPGAIIRPITPVQQTQIFDDEAREIRARADSLLRKIHVFVPRPLSSEFAEAIVPERMRSDDYIRRLLAGRTTTKKDDESPNWYDSSLNRDFGTGHLASVSYTAGKPHSRRRPYYKVADLRAADVQNDVNLLSYYAKNRQAAASALLQRKLDEDELRRQLEELKRLAEERWKAEIEERERLEREARARRLREIEEQERLEAERKAEEERIEAERIRDAQIAEEQRKAAILEEIIAKEEEERYAIEKASEEARKRQDLEEKLAEISLYAPEDSAAPGSTSDECHCHDNVKFQELEERPESPDADDDTHIEEEAGCLSTDHDDLSDCHPYDGEHEGFNSAPVLDAPVDHTPKVEEIGSGDNDEA